jgi:XapX domain-containing protein
MAKHTAHLRALDNEGTLIDSVCARFAFAPASSQTQITATRRMTLKGAGMGTTNLSQMSDQAVSYSALLLAFGTGLAVGVVFSLVKLPSPAPPFLGLIGLVGMFTGQRLWPLLASRFFHY